jgi:enterochelin esterase-like enzyme
MTSYEGFVGSEELRVNVHLPPCYQDGDRDYPVVFLLHGYPFDERHWLDLEIVETVEEGYSNEAWSPILIVMPQIPAHLNVNTDGGVGSYEEEFLNGLLPFIEDRFRIEESAEYTALAGVSRGGVWALEIGLRNVKRIGIIAALSPALHVNHPRPAYDPFKLIAESRYQPARLFLSAGLEEGGFHDKTVEFVHLLESLGIAHTYLETSGAHENSTWIGIMDDVLTFITATW